VRTLWPCAVRACLPAQEGSGVRKSTVTERLERLREVRDSIRSHKQFLDEKRTERLTIARSLRDDGVVMGVIADAAGVSDTYLTRRLIETGATRRTTHLLRGRRA
jgi:hypothetical protein